MSSECPFIKQEPDDDVLSYRNGPSETREIVPEFVNIKQEVETECSGVRIKVEPIDDESSPPHDAATNLRGNHFIEVNIPSVSVREKSKEEYVTVKAEPLEYNEDDRMESEDGTNTNVECPDNTDTISSTTDNTCPICQKVYSSKSNLQRHIANHKRKIYSCEFCSKPFYEQRLLDAHKRTHAEVGYKCDECSKEFKTSANLNQHRRIHMTVKPFSCDLCGKTFAVKANLQKHRGKKRCKIPGPLICAVCNKEFKSEYLLKSHLVRHTTEKPFTCDVCKMKFKHKATLIRHMQLHNGFKPYVCQYCNKTFTHPGLMKPHMRMHTGEKPYQCPICGKNFSHKHNMQRHTIRHEKVKKLTCELCDKRFPRESRLKYHMKTHISEKHFACFVCPKKFSHRQNILRHYKRKHPNAEYDCKETDASVASKLWNEVVNMKTKMLDRIPDKSAKVAMQQNDMVGHENETEYIVPDNVPKTVKETIVIKIEKADSSEEDEVDIKNE
ncbi:hypothetical protein evm_012224 [Chilo suppressalis]|nr:hypothetical protein evm_012224 [Chilo suppressalis]